MAANLLSALPAFIGPPDQVTAPPLSPSRPSAHEVEKERENRVLQRHLEAGGRMHDSSVPASSSAVRALARI